MARPVPIKTRLWSKSEVRDDGCIVYTGGKTDDGYGRIRADRHGPYKLAHRVAYELLVGPIPDGLQLDHLCRNRACLAPAHLEPVTQQENIARGNAGLFNSSKTHCSKGHEYAVVGFYAHRRNNGRVCKACNRDSNRRGRAHV